ncbi:MAG: cytochrome c [Thermodesulfobacteriota bacterium]
MKKFIWVAVFALTIGFSGSALASDGAGIFKSKCSACHGANAAGGPMAPALAGSDFIKGDAAAVKDTIKNGRSGGEKKYAKFAMSMPKFGLSDGELDALVSYLKGL